MFEEKYIHRSAAIDRFRENDCFLPPPNDIIATPQNIVGFGKSTLSEKAYSTLKCFVIKNCATDKPLKDGDYFQISCTDIGNNIDKRYYYDWIKKCELLGYSHVVTKICDAYVPFFSHFRNLCGYCSVDGVGCIENEERNFIWFWKDISPYDNWQNQKRLFPKRWKLDICALDSSGDYRLIYTLNQTALEFFNEKATVKFKLSEDGVNVHFTFSLLNVTKNAIRIKFGYKKGNQTWERVIPRHGNDEIHLFSNFYIFCVNIR